MLHILLRVPFSSLTPHDFIQAAALKLTEINEPIIIFQISFDDPSTWRQKEFAIFSLSKSDSKYLHGKWSHSRFIHGDNPRKQINNLNCLRSDSLQLTSHRFCAGWWLLSTYNRVFWYRPSRALEIPSSPHSIENLAQRLLLIVKLAA